MNTPTIYFHHGFLLEPFFEAHTLTMQPDYIPPDTEDVKRDIKSHEESWNNIKSIYFKALSESFSLEFEREFFDLYVVRGARRSLSRPIIIAYRKDVNKFLYDLMHELVHVLFRDTRFSPGFNDEPRSVRTHIHLFAFIEKLYTEYLKDLDMLEKIKQGASSSDYKRAWEIVEKEGYQNLLKEESYM